MTIQKELEWGFDAELRDEQLRVYADHFDEVIASPKLEEAAIKRCYTCLELMFSIIINCGTTLKLSRFRNWRMLVTSRMDQSLGIPAKWEPLFIDVFNRLEFAVEPSTIHRLVYMSQAAQEITEQDLNDILEKSHRNNRRRNVTGILLFGTIFGRSSFLQVLEGRKEEVEAVYEIIAKDPRHHSCEVCFREEGHERYFPGWSMGYRRMDQQMADTYLPGFSGWMEGQKLDTTSDGISKQLLRLIETFRHLS